MGNSRENNHNWRGGKSKTSHGYIIIRVGVGHPLANCSGYAYEHRIVAAQKLGRLLTHDEKVHHIDNNRSNNSPENLEVCIGNGGHLQRHRKPGSNKRKVGEKNTYTQCKCGCGEKLLRYDKYNRPRQFIDGHSSIGKCKISKPDIRKIELMLKDNKTKSEIARKFNVSRGPIDNIKKRMLSLEKELRDAV